MGKQSLRAFVAPTVSHSARRELATTLPTDPLSPLDPSNEVQRAMQRAVREAGIAKRATCHRWGTPSRLTCWKTGTVFGR
jgi:hypothetical protein